MRRTKHLRKKVEFKISKMSSKNYKQRKGRNIKKCRFLNIILIDFKNRCVITSAKIIINFT